ncbi:MAG: hypothetical protein K8R21_08495 [Leptospira sp.]|nr:hypothetical protein [Leptospira sp.]
MKNVNALIFLSIPFLFVFAGATFFNPWFLFSNKIYLQTISISSLLYTVLIFVYSKKSRIIPTRELFSGNYYLAAILIIPGISFTGMLLFPVNNLNLGDGILLLENVFLETGIFGYQLTLDEFLEAISHSYLYSLIGEGSPDPRVSYRILSWASGFLFLGIVILFSKKYMIRPVLIGLLLSSNGIILFHGYVENYTIVTLFLFLTMIYGYETIKRGETGLAYILVAVFLGCITIYSHLVSGYIIFALAFYCYVVSEKGNFIRNTLISSAIGLGLVALFFIYFIFLADVRADLSQTHIAHPPFYPMRRMFSLNHVYEIGSCIGFSCFVPFWILSHQFTFERKRMVSFLAKPENLFVCLVSAGFLIHGITFNPLLGFPSDWDIMSFYWLPITFLSVLVLHEFGTEVKQYYPLIIFGLLLYTGNFISLNKIDPAKEEKLKSILEVTRQFIHMNRNEIRESQSDQKKFYMKTSYFLYKTKMNLLNLEPGTEQISLAKLNSALEKELNSNRIDPTKEWTKDYLQRLTDFHSRYLTLIRNK